MTCTVTVFDRYTGSLEAEMSCKFHGLPMEQTKKIQVIIPAFNKPYRFPDNFIASFLLGPLKKVDILFPFDNDQSKPQNQYPGSKQRA
jgi:hypothetical protein